MNDGILRISAAQIQSIIPLNVLDDLAQIQSDIDNDIQILLEWLQPVIPDVVLQSQHCQTSLGELGEFGETPEILESLENLGNSRNSGVSGNSAISRRQTRSLASTAAAPVTKVSTSTARTATATAKQYTKDGVLETKFISSNYKEPSHRVKQAIRSCLKLEEDQYKFMDIYLNTVDAELRSLQVPAFMAVDFNGFSHALKEGQNRSFADYIQFIKLLQRHYDNQLDNLMLPASVRSIFDDKYRIILQLYLLRQQDFLPLIKQFFVTSFFGKSTLSAKPTSSSMTLNMIDVITTLVSVGLCEKLNEIMVQICVEKVKTYTLQLCCNVWDRPLLDNLKSFIQDEIYPDFSIIVSYTTPKMTLTDAMNNHYLYELSNVAHTKLISQRITEIFQLVLAYPSSLHALIELHLVLNLKVQQIYEVNAHQVMLTNHASNFEALQSLERSKLVDTFINECQKNLLHAGVNTIDIIIAYTKTVKSFLMIDPRGVLLDKVIRPIREYLKTRPDIFTKLVHGLLDTSPQTNRLWELTSQLYDTKSTKSKKRGAYKDFIDPKWTPDPIDALPDFKREKVGDIIESLLSIFESKDIFIQEFTTLFANQLIKLSSFDARKVGNKLALLKERFGNQSFPTLDVMIKDFETSEALNATLGTKQLQMGVLSHLYWSSILEGINPEYNQFKLPPDMDLMFKNFQAEHAIEKQGRTLKLVPSLGTVKLHINIRNQTQEFEVSPDKAAIISLFSEEKNELSIDHIASTLNMPLYMVTEGLSFWAKEGVLINLTPTLYIVDEDDD